jgi:hypothetical protein
VAGTKPDCNQAGAGLEAHIEAARRLADCRVDLATARQVARTAARPAGGGAAELREAVAQLQIKSRCTGQLSACSLRIAIRKSTGKLSRRPRRGFAKT